MKHVDKQSKTLEHVAGALGRATRLRAARLQTTVMRHEILKRDGFKCVICGIGVDDAPLKLNHLVKLIDGGEPTQENTVTVCANCNNIREAQNILTLSNKLIKQTFHFRRKIEDVMCDTAKSTCVHEIQITHGRKKTVVEQLFKTRDGSLFILSFDKISGIKGHGLRLVTKAEADEWLQQDSEAKSILPLLAKQVTSNFTLRLPTPLKEKLSTIAKDRGASLHEYIVKVLQDSVSGQLSNETSNTDFGNKRTAAGEAELVDEIRTYNLAQMELAEHLKKIIEN